MKKERWYNFWVNSWFTTQVIGGVSYDTLLVMADFLDVQVEMVPAEHFNLQLKNGSVSGSQGKARYTSQQHTIVRRQWILFALVRFGVAILICAFICWNFTLMIQTPWFQGTAGATRPTIFQPQQEHTGVALRHIQNISRPWIFVGVELYIVSFAQNLDWSNISG